MVMGRPHPVMAVRDHSRPLVSVLPTPYLPGRYTEMERTGSTVWVGEVRGVTGPCSASPVALAWGLSASVAAISHGHCPVWSSILMP